MKSIVGVLLATAITPIVAAEVVNVDVVHERGVYHVTIDALLDAPPDAVFAVLTDYPRWAEVNDLIKESVVLEGDDPSRQLVRTVAEGCVLGFCKRFAQVQWMHASDDWHIRAEVVPELSDLRAGWANTKLSESAGSTLFQYTMMLEPDFWIPPLIGPMMIKRKLRKQAIETAEAVELAARP